MGYPEDCRGHIVTIRILAALLAIAALVAVVIGARGRLEHKSEHSSEHSIYIPAAPPRTFPSNYIGIVSYNVAKFDQACGCSPNVAVNYPHMGGSIDMAVARSILAAGAVPMLELEPYGISLAKISSGSEDAWLTKYAQAVSGLNRPVIMSFAPESNGNWYSWGYPNVQPSVVISAWRHVVTVFREAGVHNVRWAWIVNVQFQGSENIRLLWPGNAFVNILGIDGYFTAPTTFQSFFGPTIVAMRVLSSDPLLITETAAAPSVGKADALSEIATGVAQYGLVGFIWFDIHQQGNSILRQDWSLEDDPAALGLFRAYVNSVR
jgi:mannan endo-1,4-beta-mannosidase